MLQAALAGQEELTGQELSLIARYGEFPVQVLQCQSIIMLDRHRYKHQKMIETLSDALITIYEAEKAGSKEAASFMKYHRIPLVNLELAFYDNRVSYGMYLGMKERVEQTLLFIKCEGFKRRELAGNKGGILDE